jgi:hypothetical protein
MRQEMNDWKLLGEILQQQHGVAAAKIDEALTNQQTSGRRLGEILLGAKAISATTLGQALASQQGLPFQ